jgi:outer membrane protein TolC
MKRMMRSLTMSMTLLAACGCVSAPDVVHSLILPEARTVQYRDTDQLPAVAIPANSAPRTVIDLRPELVEKRISLDEAIQIALQNTNVVRVLAGTTAVSSGQTIYDAPITQTTIDQAQSRFDPTFSHNNQWTRPNAPQATTDIRDFTRSDIFSNSVDSYTSTLGLTQTNLLGGQSGITWISNPIRYPGGGSILNPTIPGIGLPLNPQVTNSVALTYTQPLLQGAGLAYNRAPIVIARLNTEISFFQYKDSVQEMVRGVIEAYWSLVQARTDTWAREQQVKLSKFTYERELARLDAGLGSKGDVAQAEVTYTQFKASLIAAQANVLTREAQLRNILGLPPSDGEFLVPVSVPERNRLPIDWDKLVLTAEERRPDIVELKIIIEAEQQRLLQSENQTLPQLNASASYQWNGLTGIMPNGEPLRASGSIYPSWTLGINFSVPLGLRQGRAMIRQERLLIEKDRANLQQGLHNAIHELSTTRRDLDSAYAQYLAYRETRKAAEINYDVQNEQFKNGRAIYLNVLQALNDWGNAVSSEAAALLSYNIALATLDRREGTILEKHGLVFQEERFRAAGPLLLHSHDRAYPRSIVPAGSPHLYPGTNEPAEKSFDLREPAPRGSGPAVQFLPPVAIDRVP